MRPSSASEPLGPPGWSLRSAPRLSSANSTESVPDRTGVVLYPARQPPDLFGRRERRSSSLVDEGRRPRFLSQRIERERRNTESRRLPQRLFCKMTTIRTQRLSLEAVTPENAVVLWRIMQGAQLREFQDVPRFTRQEFEKRVAARPKSFDGRAVGRFEWLDRVQGLRNRVGLDFAARRGSGARHRRTRLQHPCAAATPRLCARSEHGGGRCGVRANGTRADRGVLRAG